MLAMLGGIDLSKYINYHDDMSLDDIYDALAAKYNEYREARAPYEARLAVCKNYREKFVVWSELAKTDIDTQMSIYSKLKGIIFDINLREFVQETDELRKLNDAIEAFNAQFK